MPIVIQLLRPVLLVGFVLATGPVVRTVLFAQEPPRGASWLVVVAVMLVFGALTVAGRQRPVSPAALVVEGVVAAVVVLVPPVQWVLWFGVNSFTHAIGSTYMQVSLMQPLAAMWLAVVAATAIRAAREARVREQSEEQVS